MPSIHLYLQRDVREVTHHMGPSAIANTCEVIGRSTWLVFVTNKRYMLFLCPRRRGGGIKWYCSPSVCLSVPWCSCHRHAGALGYRHTGCLQLSHVRTADPSADWYRSTASQTDIAGGHISSRHPWDNNLLHRAVWHSRRDVAHKKIKEVFYKAIKMRKDSGEHEDDMLQTLIDTPYKWVVLTCLCLIVMLLGLLIYWLIRWLIEYPLIHWLMTGAVVWWQVKLPDS